MFKNRRTNLSLCQSFIPLDDFFHKYKYLRCLGKKTEVSVLANLQSTGNVEATNGKNLKIPKMGWPCRRYMDKAKTGK